MPGIAFYHDSRFDLEGISESFGKEVKSSGIHMTAFEPLRKRRPERDGNQLGNPKKAASAMLTLVVSDNPPAHLLLGRDAISLVREKLRRF